MSALDPGKVVVTYRGIERLLAGGLEAATREVASDSDDLERAAFVAGLEQARIEIQKATRHPAVMAVPDHRPSSLLLSYLAQQAAERGSVTAAASGYEVKFDDHDYAGWIGGFFDWWRKLQKANFMGSTPIPDPVANELRLAILGDFGTGLYGAPACARSVESASPAFDILVHIGDVYYSGLPDECQSRLLSLWPSVPGAVSRALNGNHEMYSGGHAYFEKVLPAFGQTSSYFAFQNDHFLIAALDTAYEDHDLYGNQVGWLESLVANAGDRRLVLFTHHQPYSIWEAQGPKLLDKLGKFIADGRIFAWYWGHEHRAVLYERGPYGFYGRCIGHSGYPYYRQDVARYPLYRATDGDVRWYSIPAGEHAPVGHVLDGPNPYVTEAPAEYGAQGYASLEFSGPSLHERVHLPDGTIVYERELT
jgi:hypothetical protein